MFAGGSPAAVAGPASRRTDKVYELACGLSVLCITDTGRRHLAEGKGKALQSRRDPAGIRLLTHVAQEWTERYPAVVAAMNHFP